MIFLSTKSFLIIIFTIVFASDFITCSSRTNTKGKFELYRTVRAPIFTDSNGKYPESVISRMIPIFRKSLESLAVSYFDLEMRNEIITKDAFASVTLEMSVKCVTALPDLITALTKVYLKKVTAILNSDDPELYSHKETSDLMKILVVLIHESIYIQYKWSIEQSLTFFEYLYRFGDDSRRCVRAVERLVNLIQPNNYQKIYEIVLKFFAPTKTLLPFLFLKSESTDDPRIRNEFIEFIRQIHEKLIVNISAAERDSSVYRNNIGVTITSIIRSEMMGELDGIPFDLLQKADMMLFVKSPIFILTFEEAKAKGTMLAEFIDLFTDRLVSDEFLSKMSLEPKKFTRLCYAQLISRLEYLGNINRLTTNSWNIINTINTEFIQYETTAKHLMIFDTLKNDFMGMSASELKELGSKISELSSITPDLCLTKYKRTESIFIALLNYLPQLINEADRNASDDELKLQRYRVFVRLIEFNTMSVYFAGDTEEVLTRVLSFYNTHLSRYKLDEEHKINVATILRIAKTHRVFCNLNQYFIVSEYLKRAGQSIDEADAVINSFVYEVFRAKSNKIFYMIDCNTMAFNLNISIQPALVAFVYAEISDYLKSDSKHLGVDVYKNGQLIEIIEYVIKAQVLQKTEVLVLNQFLNQNKSKY